MALDDFLKQERAAGKKVTGNAVFTLNPEQLRKQVGTFCREHRLYPLLRCLQAIIRISESDIFIRYEKERWVVSFMWRSVPEKEAFMGLVKEGTTRAFDELPSSVTQHLFFGLSAAMGQEQYELVWRTPKGGFTINERSPDEAATVTDVYCELHFSVDPSLWSRWTGQDQYSQIKEELKQRLCYAPVPIHIEREMLDARPPKAPERPWGRHFKSGSQLAWRFIKSDDIGRVRAPPLPLDRYKVRAKGKVWDLLQAEPGVALPLSVQLGEFHPKGPVTGELPSADRRRFEKSLTGLGDDLPPVESALYLDLEAGRKDWIYPVHDGMLCEPVQVPLLKGGLVAVSGWSRFKYDLSGLKVIEDENFILKRAELQAQAVALKAELRKSNANIGLRAETLPGRYLQSWGYSVGGPTVGLVAGKIGQIFRKDA